MTFSLATLLAVSFLFLGILGFSQQRKGEDKTAKVAFSLLLLAAFLTLLVNTSILNLPVHGTFMAVLGFAMLGLAAILWIALREKALPPLLLYLAALQLLLHFRVLTSLY